MEDLKKFLLKVGVASDAITQLTESPEEGLTKEVIDGLAKDFKASQRDVFKNDPEIVGELTGSLRGKERGSVERKIKKEFGLTAEEWGENELEGDYGKAIAFGINKLKTESGKPAEKLQTELQEANQKNLDYEEKVIPGIREEAKQEISKFYVQNRYQELIGECGELIVGNDVALTVLTNEFAKSGLKSEIENGKLTIKTGDGLAPQDKDKTRNLSNLEVAKGIFDRTGLLKKSNADPDQPEKTTLKREPTPTPEPGKIELPGLQKAREHEKNLKKVQFSRPGDVFRK